ncbi:MAG TPA: hemin uptake protein HemP [Burkholderiaceae bacterium]|nr:hemin uptake protein HemP [Burkholderiaceae bacterium]
MATSSSFTADEPYANKPNGLQRSPDVESPTSVESNAAGGVDWSTCQLFGAAHEVGSRHEGHLYRLRRTKLGKLILTK